MLDETFGDTSPTFSEILLLPLGNGSASIGSVERLTELAEVFIGLLGWADRNNFPILPLRSVRFQFNFLDGLVSRFNHI